MISSSLAPTNWGLNPSCAVRQEYVKRFKFAHDLGIRGGIYIYGVNYNGGNNKTHGQVEQADRIDSFAVSGACGALYASRAGRAIPLIYGLHPGGGVVELSSGGWRAVLGLEHVPSRFGGGRTFWRCPRCGRRARYLYFHSGGFACRQCAGLNYRSQQRRRDGADYMREGLQFARDKLRWKPSGWFSVWAFPEITPPRPRYMHKATYQRRLARFRKYQQLYILDNVRKLEAVQALVG